MRLEDLLQLTQGLDFVHERHKFWIVMCIQQVVLKDAKLLRICQLVIFAICFLKEGVNLGGCEFVRIASLYLCDDRVIRFNTNIIWLSNEISCDNFLGHGHRTLFHGEFGELDFTGAEAL